MSGDSMTSLTWSLVSLTSLRLVAGFWMWALDADPIGPERAVIRRLGEFRRRRALAREARRAALKAKRAQRRREDEARRRQASVMPPRVVIDQRGRPRCARCNHEVRLRRGYCRACGMSLMEPGAAATVGVLRIVLALCGVAAEGLDGGEGQED